MGNRASAKNLPRQEEKQKYNVCTHLQWNLKPLSQCLSAKNLNSSAQSVHIFRLLTKLRSTVCQTLFLKCRITQQTRHTPNHVSQFQTTTLSHNKTCLCKIQVLYLDEFNTVLFFKLIHFALCWSDETITITLVYFLTLFNTLFDPLLLWD
jgi:hypothetical protein